MVPEQLTERPNDQKDLGEPAFSPDGKYIYFSQDDTPGKNFHYSKDSLEGIYEIKRFERESGDIETLIAGAGGAIRPTPSPDGRYLAYIKRKDFNSVLYVLDKTGEHRRVYKNMERDMQETGLSLAFIQKWTGHLTAKSWCFGLVDIFSASLNQEMPVSFRLA